MSHARLSPSAAHRWSKCPGSVQEEAKYPDVSGDAAVDGTGSHLLLELCILNDKKAVDFEGQIIEFTSTSVIVSTDKGQVAIPAKKFNEESSILITKDA